MDPFKITFVHDASVYDLPLPRCGWSELRAFIWNKYGENHHRKNISETESAIVLFHAAILGLIWMSKQQWDDTLLNFYIFNDK